MLGHYTTGPRWVRRDWRRHSREQGPSGLLRRRAACAGVPGLEPRLTEPESVGLPITPYPKGSRPPLAAGWAGAAQDSRPRSGRTKHAACVRPPTRRTSDRPADARRRSEHHRTSSAANCHRASRPVSESSSEPVDGRERQAHQVVDHVQRRPGPRGRRCATPARTPSSAEGQPVAEEPRVLDAVGEREEPALTTAPATMPTTAGRPRGHRLGEVAPEADLLARGLQRRREQDHRRAGRPACPRAGTVTSSSAAAGSSRTATSDRTMTTSSASAEQPERAAATAPGRRPRPATRRPPVHDEHGQRGRRDQRGDARGCSRAARAVCRRG